MTTTVFLDNNIWDFFFESGLDLDVELPRETFELLITREGEFELDAIPDIGATNASNRGLKEFIAHARAARGIRAQSYFGFSDPRHPADEQRIAGFDEGHWAPPRALAFIEAQRRQRPERPTKRRSKLFPLEADISLAARAFDAVVLTRDEKPGPLRDARSQGGRVLYISEYLSSGLRLEAFILSND